MYVSQSYVSCELQLERKRSVVFVSVCAAMGAKIVEVEVCEIDQ